MSYFYVDYKQERHPPHQPSSLLSLLLVHFLDVDRPRHDDPVLAARHERPPVRAEAQRQHGLAVRVLGREQPTALEIPQLQHLRVKKSSPVS